MLSVLYFAFNAVTPILLQVMLGYFLKQAGIFNKEFLRAANQLVFHYCLPAMLFCNLYGLESVDSIDWRIAAFLLALMGVLTLAGILLANLATDRRERKGVLAQAAFRSNFAIVGLPVAGALGIPGALALASAMQGPSVIYFNLMAVVVLSFYTGDRQKLKAGKLLLDICKNPLIQGLALAFLLLCVRGLLPKTAAGEPVFTLAGNLPWLFGAISSVSKAATPLALMVLGGQFEFGSMRAVGRELLWGVAMRLLAAPAIGFAGAFAAGALGWIALTPELIGVLVAILATPTAVSSVVMAGEMGADDILAGQLVVWTTIGSLFTMFFLIAGLRFVGLL